MKGVLTVILTLGIAAPAQFAPPAEVALHATGFGRAPAHVGGGQARLMAQRAAEVDALRRLAESIQGAAIRSTIDANGQVILAGGSILSGYRFLPPRGLPDGSIEVTVELPIRSLQTQEAFLVERLRAVEGELEQTRQHLARSQARIGQLEQWINRDLSEHQRSVESGRQVLQGR